MADIKHTAAMLADLGMQHRNAAWHDEADALLRRIPALEGQRDAANESANAMHAMLCAEVKKTHELEAERDRHLAEHAQCMADMDGEIDRLRAEVEALRADAERYRWLRSENQMVAGPCAYGPWMGPPMFNYELDSAIDAARNNPAA